MHFRRKKTLALGAVHTGRKGQLREQQRKHPCAEAPDPLHTMAALSDSRYDHPFLQLQQTGFDMLEPELSGMWQGINARLGWVAMLLRPLRRIASSLERIAAAMERGPPNAPPAPVVLTLDHVFPGLLRSCFLEQQNSTRERLRRNMPPLFAEPPRSANSFPNLRTCV